MQYQWCGCDPINSQGVRYVLTGHRFSRVGGDVEKVRFTVSNLDLHHRIEAVRQRNPDMGLENVLDVALNRWLEELDGAATTPPVGS